MSRQNDEPMGALLTIVLLAIILTACAASVVVLRSRSGAEASFDGAYVAAVDALRSRNQAIVDAVDTHLRPGNNDEARALLKAIGGIRTALGDVGIPDVDGAHDAETHLLRQATADHVEFLQDLTAFVVSEPATYEDKRAADLLQTWPGLSARLAALYSPGDGPSSLSVAGTAALDELTTSMIAAKIERRTATELADSRAAEQVDLRRHLQAYYYEVAGVFFGYEALRESLESQDAGARMIRTTEDQRSFEAILEGAADARYRLIDQLSDAMPPSQFVNVHGQLVDRLSDLADLTSAAGNAANEAYCSEFSSEPCERVGEAPSYISFLTEGTVLYDEYADVRDRLTATYEAQFKSLYEV